MERVNIQEFMIVPKSGKSFKDKMRTASEIYHELKNILKNRNLSEEMLDIYDLQNECHHEFEDKHEKSEIYDYFKNIKADTPKHLKYLIIEIMIELSIIGILEKIKKDKLQ